MTVPAADPTSTAVDEPGEPSEALPPTQPPRLRSARIWWVSGILFTVTLVGTLIVLLLPSGYVIEAPGNTFDTAGRVTVPADVKTFDHEGGYRFVTASETTRPIFWQALTGWLGPNTDVFPKELILGKISSAEERRFSAVLMSNSKLSAVYQALSQLGYPVSKSGGGVFVSQVIDDSPADGVLTNGDTITKIDDTPIMNTADLQRYMADEAKVGKPVTITVDRLGVSDAKKVSLTIGSQVRDGEPLPYLGIYMETRPHFRLPFSVGFDTGNVGGPSAGLALTLSLVDELSPKGLTNGNEVVATGTMNVDGTVGEIGDIRQKVAAVKRDGIRYFMVPTANYEEAAEAAGSSLEVIPVKTLEDAIAKSRALPAPKKTNR
jgi:PDZ domain-containing protein